MQDGPEYLSVAAIGEDTGLSLARLKGSVPVSEQHGNADIVEVRDYQVGERL